MGYYFTGIKLSRDKKRKQATSAETIVRAKAELVACLAYGKNEKRGGKVRRTGYETGPDH